MPIINVGPPGFEIERSPCQFFKKNSRLGTIKRLKGDSSVSARILQDTFICGEPVSAGEILDLEELIFLELKSAGSELA
jgi:hypothetical protein